MEPKLNTNIIPFIPPHIFEEILVRLDIQTLFQCAFVCRDWNDLITSFKFVSHRSGQTSDSKNQILFIKTRHYQYIKESVLTQPLNSGWRATYSLHWDNDRFDLFRRIESPPINDFRGTEVIDVSNGLVCLVSVTHGLVCLARERPFKLILWNPTIQKYACLPLPINLDARLCVGFGFDHGSNNFKVVNIVYRYITEFNNATEFDSVWVFSYTTWSWKRLTSTILSSWFVLCGVRPVLFNGVLHWIAIHNEDDRHGYEFILTFDLANEVFGQILFPIGARSYGRNTIVTTGNSLLFIQETCDDEMHEVEYDDEVISNNFSIWIMKQYGLHESWTNIFSGTTEIDPDYILGARKNGDLILNMGGREIRRYNPITPTYILMKAVERSTFFGYHSESLYLLEKGEDVNSY